MISLKSFAIFIKTPVFYPPLLKKEIRNENKLYMLVLKQCRMSIVLQDICSSDEILKFQVIIIKLLLELVLGY